jgi:hypothetical protein
MKGVKYLLGTQQSDGSWHVRGRSLPVQPLFESGFSARPRPMDFRRRHELGGYGPFSRSAVVKHPFDRFGK